MSFDHKVKRLSARDWDEVLNLSLGPVAKLGTLETGKPPALTIAGIPDLQAQISTLPQNGEVRYPSIPGVSPTLLHEGLFLLHKAANVLVSCHDQAHGGLPTWSLSTGYQAAFFSADALLKLLGIGIVTHANITCSVDVWPAPPSSLKGKGLARYRVGEELQLIRFDNLQHFHRWAILKRVLRTLDKHPLNPRLCEAIDLIDDKGFAKQRNDLHYNNSWSFPDIHAYVWPIDLLCLPDEAALVDALDPEHPAFNLALPTVLFSFCLRLVRDLGKLSPLIDSERRAVEDACTLPRMKLWSSFHAGGAIDSIS